MKSFFFGPFPKGNPRFNKSGVYFENLIGILSRSFIPTATSHKVLKREIKI